jgi:neopullulanase
MRNCIFLENHDMDRILSVLGNDVGKLKIANGILLTTRGIPQVYYGTEVLMKNFKKPSDAEVRRDFPGGWADDTNNKFLASGRTAEENDFFNYFRTIAQYRLKSEALQKGKTLQYQPQDNVYVYFRYSGTQRVMCIVNPNETAKEISADRFAEGLAGKTNGLDIINGTQLTLTGTLSIKPKTFMLVELK